MPAPDATCRGPLLINPESIARTKQRLQAGDSSLQPALEELYRQADQALTCPPVSVMDKEAIPPSGDKHDYMSYGPYWWPNPDTPDGLPYIRRDGETNPEGDKLDRNRLGQVRDAAVSLAYAFHFSGRKRYAEHAVRLLQTWFLDAATRMNPHLNYGQAIPGKCDGRGIGIIDTCSLCHIVDAVRILQSADGMSPATVNGIEEWMKQYLHWLVDSPIGQDEASQHNNHGTWYDVQVACLALFVGLPRLAEEMCRLAKERRIASQVEPDGSMPHELARTRSRCYTAMNLRGMIDLATLGRHVDVDLFNYSTDSGRGIRQAIDWLLPYATGEKPWTWQEISEFSSIGYADIFRRAAIAYQDDSYEQVLASLDQKQIAKNRVQLIYPAVTGE